MRLLPELQRRKQRDIMNLQKALGEPQRRLRGQRSDPWNLCRSSYRREANQIAELSPLQKKKEELPASTRGFYYALKEVLYVELLAFRSACRGNG